jgi:peroxiredoxin
LYKLAIAGARLSSVRFCMLLGLLVLPVVGNAIEPGDIAPDFTLPILANPTDEQRREADAADSKFALLSLSDYRNKVIYLDFWQASCAPCRESLPLLTQHRDEFAEHGVEILAVNTDVNPADALALVAKFAVNYPVVSDPGAQVASRYGLSGLPTAYLIARDGRVHQVREGFASQDIDNIRATLFALGGNVPNKLVKPALITKVGD